MKPVVRSLQNWFLLKFVVAIAVEGDTDELDCKSIKYDAATFCSVLQNWNINIDSK